MHYNKLETFTYVDNLNQENISKLNKKVQIIFRNYKDKFKDQDLIKFVDYCKINRKKVYLSNDLKRAKKLGFDGVYIPSFNNLTIDYKIGIKKDFTILGSAHNVKELIVKKKQNTDIIFISPLFKTDKNKKNLGVIKFNLLSKNTKQKIIALGGVNKKNESILNILEIDGFAAISYFRDKN